MSSIHLFRVRWKMELDGVKMVGHDRWSTKRKLLLSQNKMNQRDYPEMEFGVEHAIIDGKDGKFQIYREKYWDSW